MPEHDLSRVAQEYADLLNRSEPALTCQIIDEACIEPHWDERSNLFQMLATAPEDMALVLSSEPGGDDYVVVRFITGEWVVDATPVDWDEMEEEAFEPRDHWWTDTA
jgi:hypothetical protein